MSQEIFDYYLVKIHESKVMCVSDLNKVLMYEFH